MLLNNFGEPVALEEFAEKHLDRKSPLLLSSSKLLNNFPEGWCGTVYSTHRIVNESKELMLLKSSSPNRIGELEENKPTVLDLSEDSHITVTAFSWTKEKEEPKLIFLIKDQYLTRICIDTFTKTLNSIISNDILRGFIKEGIDVVHFNDKFAMGSNPRDPKIQHTWSSLHLLTYLIRPKKICGFSETTLPKYITQCCSKLDINKCAY
ncbi:uncharacterized protein LOC126756628 [Bactrocera neohumeralis]|uniref:uncharacterized protein LOC120771387 n=1 Tax=Bactrocera tryoni TaxID=59916 RepID=UPI001A973E3E|nr:uncharacterized protein LOC120771387 [Bactrocera tryoni]XP_050325788.1 uncharacterized protein LOC126756628 [Bactrocera neohumeralis]